MQSGYLRFIFLLCVGFVISSRPAYSQHNFYVKGDQFYLDNKPFKIHSGSIHYTRIPEAYWEDRIIKAKAMGLNTICTYVFWNAHESRPGHFDFTGNLNLAKFIRLAQKHGLYVILRPSPYVCAEWDFGGLPAWLLKYPDLKVRCNDSAYMFYVKRYMLQLGKQVENLQITKGGPIILCQLENEYGGWGNDHNYLKALKKIYREAGFEVQLFSSDWADRQHLTDGVLPDVLPVINFGNNPQKNFTALDTLRPGIPQMCGEYWCGWFTPWGKRNFSATDGKAQVEDVKWMLQTGKSFNLYMFDGGTNFGFTAGANLEDGKIVPDVTSYDYDAPLNEAGEPTPKYYAMRKLLQAYLPPGKTLPPVPDSVKWISFPAIHFNSVAALFSQL
ncbi:MAG TPA: beta-galactosidase family protein, partial [Chitinophagaceae bacterium]